MLGGVTKITDPGLVHCNGLYPVEVETESLAERFPGAVIIHPGGTRLFAAGWHGEGDWDFEGSPTDVAAAFGITAQESSERGIDINAAVDVFYWEGLCRLALKKVAPLNMTGRTASVFRVKHTEDATGNMEEIWLEE
jgi:hypothetical protein